MEAATCIKVQKRKYDVYTSPFLGAPQNDLDPYLKATPDTRVLTLYLEKAPLIVIQCLFDGLGCIETSSLGASHRPS